MQVELPNGQIGEFPDSMSHEQIELVLRKQFPPKIQEEIAQKQPEEEQGFWGKLPRDILIGLSNLGHSTQNMPYDLAKNIEQQGMDFGQEIHKKLPMFGVPNKKSYFEELVGNFNKEHNVPESMKNQDWNQSLAEHIPHQPEYDFAQMLGEKDGGTLVDKIIQKGVEHIPDISGLTALMRGGARRLKGTYQLNKVEKSVKEKGLSNFNYPSSMIKQAKKYLPPSEATKEMISQVQSGNYSPAFSMQSQVGHHQRNLANSVLPADRLLAPKVGDLKQNMLGHLEKVLREENLHEDADLLRTGIRNYGQYMRVKNAVIPILKKAGIPVTILTALGFGYKKAKKSLR